MRSWLLAFLSASLAACSAGTDDGIVDVAFIAEPGELAAEGVRLSPAGQHVRAAVSTGLVRLDRQLLILLDIDKTLGQQTADDLAGLTAAV